jgi:hypothetical protein
MNKCPLSVTIICWIHILLGSLLLLGTLLRLFQPDSRQIIFQHFGYFLITRTPQILSIICGVFMLFGFNWARQLIFVWFASAAISIALFQPGSIWKPVLLFIVSVYFLFRQPASDYFRGVSHELAEIPKTDDKPVA